MSPTRVIDTLRRQCRRFLPAQQGNVAVTFAIAVIPIVGFTGAAIDYSRASSVKAAMQAALDATALAMSKEAASVSSSQLQTDAAAYFAAAFNRPDAKNVRINASYSTSGGSSVTVTGTGSIQTNFMGIMGINSIPVSSSSKTAWGMTRLRVSLVLDNTGSMADAGKMTALKTATKNLLTQLQNAAASPGDVYVSIVPFSKDVNVGSSNYNANWIDWSDWEDDNGSWQYSTSCSGGWSRRGRSRCTTNYTWVPKNHNTWNGCVTDRDQNYDTLATAPKASDASLPGSTPSTLFPAEQYSSCPQPIMGLGYNWSAMRTLVDNMSPDGNTNQGIGLAWGWLSLTGGGPLTAPAMDANYQYTQVIVLLTDGLNTENRWYTSQSSIDAREKILCDNIKAAKITLYAIQVNTGSDAKSSVLQYCASDSSKFFYLTSASQISGVFNAIGTNLAKLRIAK